MGGNAPEVKNVMAGNKAAPHGLSGAHGIYRDTAVGASQASGDLKLLPNQVQSVSWESIKGLFSSAQRRDPVFVDQVRRIWNEYAQGRAKLEEVHARIFDAAGGISNPDWAAR
jgi:hypothetical protein